MAAALDELQRDVGKLRRELADLQHESRTNQGVLAGAIRKTRKAQTEQDQRRAVARLAQPAGLVNWSPRAGDQANPDMNTSLIDRLRKGQPVADSLGNTAPFFGQTNLLADPTFENCTTSVIAVGTAETVIGRGNWFAFRSATSCTASSVREYARDDSLDNPFNTEALRLLLNISGAGTHKLTLDSDSWVNISIPILPYLVTAIRISRLFVDTHTNITSNKMFLELVDGPHGGAGVVRGSTVIDLDDLVPYKGQTQMVASSLYAGQAWVNNDFHLRVRLEVVTTGAAVVSYHVGEPQLVMTYSPDPGPFTPLLAGWQAPKLVADGARTTELIIDSRVGTVDTVARFAVAADGVHSWGPGNATRDRRLQRGTNGQMQFDTNGQAINTWVQFQATAGQRAVISLGVAGEAQERTALWGDATGQSLEFGGGGTRDMRLWRNGAGNLVIDTNGAATATDISIQATAGGAQAVGVGLWIAGEGAPRLKLRGDAFLIGLEFGGGGTPDLRAYRNAAGNLAIDTNGQAVQTHLQLGATSGQRNVLSMLVSGEAQYRMLQYGDASVTGWLLGGGGAAQDIRIYRAGAGYVALDANGQANQIVLDLYATAGQRNRVGLLVVGDTTQRVWLEGSATVTGLHLGPGNAALDVRMYRNGAKILEIDDAGGGNLTQITVRAALVDFKGPLFENGTQVVGTRKTGWAVATNTKSRATFDTTTVTLPNLAARVGALIDDLHGTAGHGLIGT